MAEPLLSFLVGRAKLALPYLRGAARQGLSAAAAIDLLKPFNLTFQRQRMLDVYNSLLNRFDPERAARLVGESVPIPQELHKPSPAAISSNYQYVVGAFDAAGNSLGALTVSSAVPLAAVDIRNRAILTFESDAQLYLEDKTATVSAISIMEANVSDKVPPL